MGGHGHPWCTGRPRAVLRDMFGDPPRPGCVHAGAWASCEHWRGARPRPGGRLHVTHARDKSEGCAHRQRASSRAIVSWLTLSTLTAEAERAEEAHEALARQCFTKLPMLESMADEMEASLREAGSMDAPLLRAELHGLAMAEATLRVKVARLKEEMKEARQMQSVSLSDDSFSQKTLAKQTESHLAAVKALQTAQQVLSHYSEPAAQAAAEIFLQLEASSSSELGDGAVTSVRVLQDQLESIEPSSEEKRAQRACQWWGPS